MSTTIQPTTMSAVEKIAKVKAHYASIANGQSPIVGSSLAKNTVRYVPPAPVKQVEKTRDPKLWTIVNNKVRPSKWKTYYDAGDDPSRKDGVSRNLLETFEESWSDHL